MIGIKSTLRVFREAMGWELFVEGARSAKITTLDIGGMKHSRKRKYIKLKLVAMEALWTG